MYLGRAAPNDTQVRKKFPSGENSKVLTSFSGTFMCPVSYQGSRHDNMPLKVASLAEPTNSLTVVTATGSVAAGLF